MPTLCFANEGQLRNVGERVELWVAGRSGCNGCKLKFVYCAKSYARFVHIRSICVGWNFIIPSGPRQHVKIITQAHGAKEKINLSAMSATSTNPGSSIWPAKTTQAKFILAKHKSASAQLG